MMTRNLALEALVFETEIHCDNCNKKLPANTYDSHHCDQGVYKCRRQSVDSNYEKRICRWMGHYADLNEHFQKDHPLAYFLLEQGRWFKWKLPFAQDQDNVSIIKSYQETFLQEVYYEHQKKLLYFAVYNLNNTNNKSYQCTIVLKNGTLFESNVERRYINIQQLKEESNLIRINIGLFEMRNDREITWILNIYQVEN